MKKFSAVLLCLAVLLTAVACATASQQTHQLPEESTTPQAQEETNTNQGAYDDIITQYTALLTAKYNGEELPSPNTEYMDEREAAIAEALYNIVDSRKSAESAQDLGYGYKDFDGNGITELVLLSKYTSVSAIFTLSDEKPILLEANYGVGNSIIFAKRNRFFIRRQSIINSIEKTTFYICRVDGDTMAYDTVCGATYNQENRQILEYFQITGGNKTIIDKDTFNELTREIDQSSEIGYSDISKLLSPRIHYPLKKDVPSQDLPIADFSSYAAIRSTYQAISNCIDVFESSKWHLGEYDNLFAFPNELSFEYYMRLLYATHLGSTAGGYDELDLNGDGQDELILLNEDYRIKAIFTQKNGIPVLLDAFSYETCWLDDQGFIHVDREEYYELEYILYEFTKSGEYKLIYSILCAKNGNRYLTKDGKTERISFEKSLELYYDEYCRYSEPFDPHEQTRNVSELTFTPLTESAEAPVKAATDKTWHKNAYLEKTTGSDLAHSDTYVTFENVTDAQMDVNFKYAFTYYYPDPDRENYLLGDTVESSLKVTARAENGTFTFNQNGIKGRFEFGHSYMWLIIEESSDERFHVGYHCYGKYTPQDTVMS